MRTCTRIAAASFAGLLALTLLVAWPCRVPAQEAAERPAPPAEPAPAPTPLTVPFSASDGAAAQAVWAASLGRQVIEKNSIGMELVLIPPGKLKTGQADAILTRPYCIGKTEVTQRQWQAVVGMTPWKGNEFVREGDDFPATHLSWEDAQVFCRKLSEREKVRYRLPTEAEWEFAARAGTTTTYSFGSEDRSFREYGWYGGFEFEGNARGERYPHEVATKKPNPFGLYDIHGNMWEWCEDVHAPSPMTGTDPVRTGTSSVRVFRGGSWTRNVGAARTANREWYTPANRTFDIGLRVVCEVPAK